MIKKCFNMGELLVLVSSFLWGIISAFIIPLANLGFNSLSITFVRSLISTLFLLFFIVLFNKNWLKIELKDLVLFFLLGAICYCFTCSFYAFSIELNGASLSSMLLYTSPIWTIVFSLILFKNKVNFTQVLSLMGIIVGCVFITFSKIEIISVKGVLVGLLSGVLLASYNVVSKVLSKKYNALTITFYAFLFSSISSFFLAKGWKVFGEIFTKPKSISYFIFLSVFITAIPYLLYNFALKRISPEKASMISSSELIVSVLCGVILFKNTISFQEILGIIISMASIIFMNFSNVEKIKNKPIYLSKNKQSVAL